MLVLDTSAMIEVAKGSERGQKIMEFLGDKAFTAASFSVYEALFPEKGTEKISEMIDLMEILNFDKESAKLSIEIEKDLKKAGKMINLLDIFIAAICVKYGYEIITCDEDFKKISKIKARVF